MAVFMPMTWPAMSTSGPPELPGLMAASVWMKRWNWARSMLPAPGSSMARFLAETMPAETVWERPKGLPMARTQSPTCALSELPILMVGRVRPLGSILMTAMSVSGSVPTTVAGRP